MKRSVPLLALVSAAIVVAGALSLRAARAESEGPAPVTAARAVDPRDVRVGELAPDVALTLADGTTRPLSALAGKRGLLVVARSETCPVGRRYGAVLAGIEGEAAKAGVNVVYVNVQKGADAATAAAAAKDYGFAAPYAIDATRAAATALRLRSTTEVLLLDAARTVVYRGAVDDQFAVGLMRDAARETWLRDALKALAAGKRPHVEATTAPGCALDLSAADAPVASAEAPAAEPSAALTWHNRISRIVDRNCAECHRAGENGPFPLVTLADVTAQAEMTQVVVEDRTMPPWFAADVREHPAEGGAASGAAPRREPCPPMGSDQRLSERDRADFLAWLRGGMPAGDPKDAAVPLVRESGWRIGTPDLVLEVEDDFAVPATGTVGYQYRWVKASFPEDRWVRGFEVRPSAPSVVHHVLVFARNSAKKKQGIFDGGLTGFFAAMVPGSGSVLWPDGMAKRLPAGTDLLFQIHYTPNGKPAKDRPKIGLVFAKEPPREEVKTRGVFDMKFAIPPGAARHEVRATWTFPESGRILEFMPHMHVRGTAFRYELETPDGARTTLLEIPRYDFNWQLVYRLRDPVVAPKGSRVIATGWFDNSAKNPANPDPAATVRVGEQTYEEMMIGYLDWVPDAPPAATSTEK